MNGARHPALRLEVNGLEVRRGLRTVFSDVSFSVGAGDYLEVTGPNGAGKTSLLRALAGLLRPAAGTITLYGNVGPLEPEALVGMTHYLGHRDGLKPTLSGQAHAAFWGRLLGGEAAQAGPALAQVGLGTIADLPGRAYSAGQSRRLALSRLLCAPRPLWLLDEPAAALDRAGKTMLAGLIGRQRDEGGAVIAAVHEPLEAVASNTLNLRGFL